MYINSFFQFLKLNKHQWLRKEKLEKLQWKKLKFVLNYAHNNVPFYREKFKKANLKPSDIKKSHDMLNIPVTTKEELRLHFPAIAQKFSVDDLYYSKTSGSTGEPIKTFYNKSAWIHSKYLIKIRARLACGLKIGDRIAVLDALNREEIAKQEKKGFSIFNLFIKKKTFSVFEDVEEQISLFESFKPNAFDGYPSYLKLLAEFVKENNLMDIKPRIVFTTAEMLDRKTRRIIETGFNASVFDIYGCTEFKEISWECKNHEGYHTNIDSLFVEFTKNQQHVDNGEKGEIVCTSLYNEAMPLIRYTIGNVGKKLEYNCSCGRGLPLMDVLMGRTVDCFSLPQGKIVSPYSLTTAIETINGLLQYQIIQEKIDSIKVKARVSEGFSEKEDAQLKANLLKIVGKGVNIELKIVEKIEREKNGKYRVVLSKVKK
ncbi:MAG: phenylacetate--CoA ligase family protein [Candidatus Methanofastidiosia archaeon]